MEVFWKRPYLFPVLVVAGAILSSLLVIAVARAHVADAQGQEPTDEEIAALGITFPIPELGNCRDKNECRAYCSDSGHMQACIEFAEKHGLMNREEAAHARRFSGRLSSGEGPGGCRSPRDCEAFCSSIENIETCVRFAEEQGFAAPHLEEGKKLLTYIESGGKLPGGCDSKESCERYCGDFRHAEECFEFARRAGITQVREEVPGRAEGRFEGGIPPGQFQKFLELVKRGETPGGCRSKDECEVYCRTGDHFEECIAFGEKIGFVDREHGEQLRKLGGKGPGGCDSPQSCEAYCNEPTHHEACFKFAEEHGLIPEEELKRAKEGFLRLREGLEHAPPEVAQCLKSVLGPNIIEDIESGKLVPGPQIGERMRGCFERFGHRGDPHEVFENAPPQVVSCLKEKVGDAFEKIRSGEILPTPEMADSFRVCFEQFRFEKGEGQPMIFHAPPPKIAECLRGEFGENYEKEIQSLKMSTDPDFKRKVMKCFEEFRPHEGEMRRPEFPRVEPKFFECAKLVLSPEALQRFLGGEKPSGDLLEEIQACVGSVFVAPAPVPVPRDGNDVEGCVRSVGGDGLWREWQEGRRPSGDVLDKISACIVAKTNTGRSEVCIQVITPAQDPASGACKEFPTPCDVPPGWVRGCTTNTSGAERDLKAVCPFISTVDSCPAGYRKAMTFSSPECGTYYTCVQESSTTQPSP